MTDAYFNFANQPFGRFLFSKLGLPIPPVLQRANGEHDQLVDRVAVLTPENGVFAQAIHQALDKPSLIHETYQALVFDASFIQSSAALIALQQQLQPALKKLTNSGKLVLIGIAPNQCATTAQAIAQRALQGFVKSLAKELGRKGITVNLLYADAQVAKGLAAPLRFLCSKRNVYITGQVLTIADAITPVGQWQKPLQGKIALVTGAAQGIGASIATTLARDGALVIGLDMAQAEQDLTQLMNTLQGESLLVNMLQPDAWAVINQQLAGRAIDIIVHNAGITRDKMFSRMEQQQWEQLVNINLTAIEQLNTQLLEHNMINNGGRIICVSSISGIAGNIGQTNYAASKAGVIGLVEQLSAQLSSRDITVNAVAPGFIETKMTQVLPLMTKQVGRRACSFSQGGTPIDVAEAIALFAAPQSQGLTGQVLRVCGQNILGA